VPTMSIHDCEIHYEDSGGTGPPVVLLHGFVFDGRMFDAQVEALRDRYRCITMDFRGQGRSRPTRKGFQVEQQTADVLALLRRLEVPPAHLVGLSMGGYVSMRIAARHPDRVLTLSLLNTGAGPHPARRFPEHLGLAGLIRVFGTAQPRLNTELEKALYSPSFRDDPATEPVRRRWRERWAGADVSSLLRTLLGIMRRPDFRPELPDIAAPTLVLTGSQDVQHPPEHARQIVEGVPDSSYVELPDVGHSASFEAPEAVTAALEQHLGR
jgi:3-oxoadipate enol-lactonase